MSRAWWPIKPGAQPLDVELGDINFKDINFWYTDGDVKTQVFCDFQPAHSGRPARWVGGNVRGGQDHAHQATAAPGRHPGR